MVHSFFEKIQAFSTFLDSHRYCLPHDVTEKGIRLLATSSEEFRKGYSHFFLTKVLSAFCTFESKVQQQSEGHAQKARIFYRLFKEPSAKKSTHSTLGIAVAIKIKGYTELLGNQRLLQAILHITPGVVLVPSKSYSYRDEQSGMLFVYEEIVKKRGRGFSRADIQQLKKCLSRELEESIESLSPSLFFVRNEEEILRSIIQMGRELNEERDMPQVTISFQEQTPHATLRFSVVILRLVQEHSPTLEELSRFLPQSVQFIPEMTSEIGLLNAAYSKEANTVIFEIESAFFARKNNSIDLREARSYIAKALELMIGEFRDYNGGLFSKQNTQLRAIKELLGESNRAFMESLFYAFTPSTFQTFLLPDAIQACASLFLEAKKTSIPLSTNYELFKQQGQCFSLIVLKTNSKHLKNAIVKEAARFLLPINQFGYAVQSINGEYYVGLIYQYPTDTTWFDSIEALIQTSQNPPKKENKYLRINFQDGDPLSLNPQLGLDLRCRSVQKALFEGLTRMSPAGKPELAAALRVEISEDGKKYLFTLKKIQWSNGEELTAFQFEQTWKKAITSSACLRPDVFYIIQNAKQARSGLVSRDAIGVKALDRYRLQVSLEYPAPYFLEMLSLPLFFPLYEEVGEPYVFSGPFILHSWNRDHSLVLVKNPYYWDFENVKLEGIEISIIRDPLLAFHKYEKGEIDWIGGPFSLLPPTLPLSMQDQMHRVDTPGVAWLYCNLTHPLFSSAKIRTAFSYALDRKQMCAKTFLNPVPLKTHLPSPLSQIKSEDLAPDPKLALELFELGLKETNCSRQTISKLMLSHSHTPGQKELTAEIQRQWQEIFDIKIERVEETWNTFSHQLDNRLIHFGSCYRHPFYNDPMYFFHIFYEATNIHNAFGWQNEHFNHLIKLGRDFPHDPSYLKAAEHVLLEQMPVIPLNQVTYHYLARDDVHGIHFCHSGDVDFRWVYFG